MRLVPGLLAAAAVVALAAPGYAKPPDVPDVPGVVEDGCIYYYDADHAESYWICPRDFLPR